MPVLTGRALNRATLARQLLLSRADMPPLAAVAHVCGLQAQEPQEPFVGLWSRLHAFAPGSLSSLLTDREVVRLHLMRRTVHLMTSTDALAWRSRHDAMLRQRVRTTYRQELDGVDEEDLAAVGHALMSDGRPRTMPELARELTHRWPAPGPRPLGEMLMAALLPVAQLPPRGLWRTKGPASYALLSTWLGREVNPLPTDDSDPVGQSLARRYLTAFGPASTSDLRAWSGLSGLPAAIKAIREELVTFKDEQGRELLDLPAAPRPDPDTPAPVRFLPAFDNAILGYQDRTRIIDNAHKGLSVAGERVVLVDGRVSATWSVTPNAVTVTPLRAVTRSERTAIAEEGHDLALFLSEGESAAVTITDR